MTEAILSVLLIFVLRVLNNALGTVRLILITYGRRWPAFMLAFVESLTFAVTAGVVLTDLDNVPNLTAYAAGFAVGGYVGMLLEERFITGYVTITIISKQYGADIATVLRDNGFGVTETLGEGVQGSVSMLRCVVERKQTSEVIRAVQGIHPDAFITVEEARAVQRGWLNNRRSERR